MVEETSSICEGFERKPFILSAKALQKIADIITARKEGDLYFALSFSDGSAIDSVDLTRVLHEENLETQQLTRVSLSFREKQNKWGSWDHQVRLAFRQDRYDPISLDITGKDSDWIKITSWELRQVINEEVIVDNGARALLFTKWAIGAAVLGASIWGAALLLRSTPSPDLPPLTQVVKSADPNVKLNYLLQRRYAPGPPFSVVLALSGLWGLGWVALWTLWNGEFRLLKHLYPMNEFLIGAGEERVRKRLHLREQLFWVVLVGLGVSTLAGVLLSLR